MSDGNQILLYERTNLGVATTNTSYIYTKDVNAAAGHSFPHATGEASGEVVIAGTIIKATTGNPTYVHEGLLCINTYDNNYKVYADAAWRTITTW
jgi:hypothetical protein